MNKMMCTVVAMVISMFSFNASAGMDGYKNSPEYKSINSESREYLKKCLDNQDMSVSECMKETKKKMKEMKKEAKKEYKEERKMMKKHKDM